MLFLKVRSLPRLPEWGTKLRHSGAIPHTYVVNNVA